MSRDGKDNDFMIHGIIRPGQIPSGQNRHLDDYIRSIVDPTDRRRAVNKLTDQITDIGWKMTPIWRKQLVDAGLMQKKGSETAWTTTPQLLFLAHRYNIPVVLYNLGNIHWVLMLGIPRQERGEWKAPIYNPMESGESERVIPKKDMIDTTILVDCPGLKETQRPVGHQRVCDDDFKVESAAPGTFSGGSLTYQLSRLDELTGGYDLRIPKFTGDLSALHTAKIAPLETRESYNCGLWCLAHAAIAWGIRPGNNIFKEKGLRQLASDTGVVVVTPEGVMSELFTRQEVR